MLGAMLPEGFLRLLAHGFLPTVHTLELAQAVSRAARGPARVYVRSTAATAASFAPWRRLPGFLASASRASMRACRSRTRRDWPGRPAAAATGTGQHCRGAQPRCSGAGGGARHLAGAMGCLTCRRSPNPTRPGHNRAWRGWGCCMCLHDIAPWQGVTDSDVLMGSTAALPRIDVANGRSNLAAHGDLHGCLACIFCGALRAAAIGIRSARLSERTEHAFCP